MVIAAGAQQGLDPSLLSGCEASPAGACSVPRRLSTKKKRGAATKRCKYQEDRICSKIPPITSLCIQTSDIDGVDTVL